MKQKLLILIFLLSAFGLNAQTLSTKYNSLHTYSAKDRDAIIGDSIEVYEGLVATWDTAQIEVKHQLHVSDKDFKLFTNFYESTIDSEHFALMKLIRAGKIDRSNVASYIDVRKQKFIALYTKFLDIKKEFPSSVDEASPNLTPADVAPVCEATCSNMNFATGNFSGGWYGYYGKNSSSTLAHIVTGTTGGLLGAVSKGANVGGGDYQLHITKATNNDWFLSNYHSINMSQAPPTAFGFGTYAAMIGDSVETGGHVGILSQKFTVSATTNSITYAYAVFLENPQPPDIVHATEQQPYFSVTLFNQAGDTITTCGEYNVVSSGGHISGFQSEYFPPGGDTAYWKTWTEVNVPLSHYVGQCVTIQFEVADCEPSGHFGYAYVDAICSQLIITPSAPAICGNGTINLDGPVGESSYLWTGPAGGITTSPTAQDVTVKDAGTYTLVITPVTGALCADTLYCTVTKDTISATAAQTTNIACNGGTATAVGTGANGVVPYTYAWAPSAKTTATATGLSAGTYTVTISDIDGCSATASVSVTQPPVLTAAISGSTNLPCGGTGSGTATVTAGGGTTNYTYKWMPGGNTNADATGLSAGSYTITVTDADNCTATASVTLTQPPTLTASLGAQTSIPCNGGTASITVTGGGGAPAYVYSWSPNGGSSATGTGLTAGSYTVTITDADGCTATASITITQPPLLTATIVSSTNVLCNGGTGKAQVTAGGGTLPYTYSWSPNGGAGGIGTGLSAGTYTVTVTDRNNCSVTASVTITQPPVLTATISASTNEPCNGNSVGSATVTVGGGTPNYTYAWTPSGGSNASATGLSIGTYKVKVTDADGCTATASVTITQPPVLTATMGAATNVACNGGTGSATVTAGGGTVNYTYAWSPSGGSNAEGTGLTAGGYTVTITDADGCTATASVTITQPPVLTANMGPATNVLCNGGTGNATVTAGGGTVNYAYAWSPNGGSNAEGTGLTAGGYTVTITDAHGCTATASVTITQPPALTASMGPATNEPCNGNNVGNATVTAGGGTPNYTYVWTPNGGSNAEGTGLTAGTYTVKVTDADGCTATASVTITQPPVLTASMGPATNEPCNGNNVGNATVTAGGGTPNYTYVWSPNGGSNAEGTGLTAGGYTVTITDADGCTKTASITITQPPVLTATMGPATNVVCNGGTGNATVTAGGGTANYTYAWSPNGGSNAEGTGLTAGGYTVTITDAHGCQATASVTITQPPALTASMGPATNVLCNGGTGNATVTAGGGTVNYAYAWSPNGGSNAEGTGLTAGDYTVTITDAHGCQATASVTITQPPALTATMGPATNVLCNGGTGNATVTAGGGTPNYTYAWSPSGGSNAEGTGLTAGGYTVTITDADGCTATASVTITQPLPLGATTSFTQASCNLANGSATVNVTGGTTAYIYSWSPTPNTNADATGLSAGNYTVTVTDAHGCTITASVTVTEPSTITANMGASTNVVCNGGIGNATVIGGGGTLPYTYSWSPNGGNNVEGTGLTAGDYTVTVTDNNGCAATASVTITQPPILTATMGAATNVLCNGGTGNATVTAGGGTPNYTYVWSPNGGSNAEGTGLTAGGYTVTIIDAHGCQATASITITQPPILTATMGAATNVLCNGGTGSATVTGGGGTLNYTYVWSPNGGNNAMGSGLTAGAYTVTITDADGCTATASVMITQPPVLTANMGPATNVLCNGGNNASATVTAGGGTPGYVYVWSPNGGSNAEGTGLTAGDYTVTVTDVNGCIATASVVVTQPTVLTATMGIPTNVLCNGGDNGSSTVTPGGGTPNYTYVWNPNGGSNAEGTGLTAGDYTVTITDADGCTATASVTITQPPVLTATMGVATNVPCNGGIGNVTVAGGGGTPNYGYVWSPNGGSNAEGTGLTAGDYTVTITDADGCTATASVTITQPLPLGTSMSFTQASCGLANGTATVDVTGGTTTYIYSWSPTPNTNATATGLLAGNYTVTVTDAHGCTITASVTVTEPSAVTAVISGNVPVLCNGGNNASATVTAGGGTPGYVYVWSPNGGSNAEGTGLTAGDYTVTVTDVNGCIATASVVVTQPTVLTATMGIPTNVLCNGGDNGSSTVTPGGGTPNYTYVWNPNGGSNAEGTGLTAGDYTVTITDADGCTATASVTITQPPVLTATMGVATNVPCNGGIGNVTVAGGGGTPNYGYVWSPNGGSNAEGTGLTAGDYTVTITDADGCTATASVTITQPLPLGTSMSFTQASCGLANGTATVDVTGGTTTYIYSWSPTPNTNATATGLLAGNYTVTVTDAHGCTITASVTVTEPSAVTAVISGNVPVLCNGGNNASATVTAGGGTPGYVYVWSPNGGSNAEGTGLTAGDYTVTVTDVNGCIATASVVVTQPTVLTATMGIPTNVLCNGGDNGSSTVTPGGGTPNYTYVWNPNGGSNAEGTGLTAGDYTVTITDADGCTATASVTITQPPVLTATMGVATNVPCNGGIGNVTVAGGGGTPNYGYVWSPNGGSNAEGTGLTAGDYTVTITDADGCTATASVTITQPLPLGTSMSFTQASCGLANGTATVDVTGGTTTYIYSWSPTPNTNATATGLLAGNYTVTVTDAHGCTITASVTVTEPSAVTAVISGNVPVLCNGGNNASATVTAGGGTPGYVYVWSPNGGSNAEGTGLTAGDYTVTVTDVNGCIATASVVVTQPTVLTATMGIPTNVLCNGGDNGSSTVTPGGGTPNYTYVWNPNGGSNAEGTGLTAGDYTVTITDADGCTATASVTITQPPVLTATMGVATNVPCNGGIGNVTVAGGGGTPNYGYVWSPNGGSNAEGTGLTAGDYTVTITDADGCTATASVTITQPLPLGTSMSFTQASCGLANGTATVDVTGGTTTYIYSWSPTPNTNATATGLLAGNYTVTVTDAHGCTITASVTVTEPSAVTAVISGNVPVLCNGGNNASATVTAGGGTPGYVYVWSPNGGSNAEGTGLTAGDYTVTVTDVNGCIATASVVVTQPTVLTATMGIPTNVLCNGGDNGSSTVTPGGGTPNYTYVWNPNGGSNAEGTGLTAGDYTVTITDADGCTATASVTITQPPVLTATMGVATNVLCNGGNNAHVTVTAGGGTLPYKYNWTPNGGTNAEASGLTAGDYTVTIIDADGCIATTSVIITQPLVLTATMDAPTNVLCNGGTGSATVVPGGGTPVYLYTWSPNGGSNANATGLTAGAYTVTIKDADGCIATASVTITQPAQLGVTVNGPQSDCSGAPITLTSLASGGTTPYLYNWTPVGGTTATTVVSPLVTTTYTMTVTDAHGCTVTTSLTVNVSAPLSVVALGDTEICPGGKVILTAHGAGGDGIYSYLWLPSNLTTQTVSFSPLHDTVVTVQLRDGCGSTMVSLNVPITIQTFPNLSFSADVLSGCAPLCIQFRDYSTSYAIAQWRWNFGNGDSLSESSPIYCYKDTGKYSVTLTETSTIGCSATLKIVNMITVYPPPIANFTYAPQPINITNSEVQFTDLSKGEYPIVQWNWRFGQGDSTSAQSNPSHYYPDTGTYCPTLTVMDIHGCIDSTTQCLEVNPLFGFYIPNAFSPNGDGINDVFMPKGTYIKDYEMYVFDRWGMKLFHSTDINNGWNGTVDGGTTVAQEDVYVYIINVTDSQGNQHSYTGRVTLLK